MRLMALVLGLLAGPALGQGATALDPDCYGPVSGAHYDKPSTKYGHAVLGDRSEWEMLVIDMPLKPECGGGMGGTLVLQIATGRVFEDWMPRLADLDGDGVPEVMAVESDMARGARLSVYKAARGEHRLLAATGFIGTRHRWLAQLGAADLDGDGRPEIAWIDRPHLDRVLRIARLEGDRLVELAAVPGFTAHRFGEPTIPGGLRDCGAGAELVLASADWSRLVAVRLDGGRVTTRDLGPDTSDAAFAAARACG